MDPMDDEAFNKIRFVTYTRGTAEAYLTVVIAKKCSQLPACHIQ